MAKSKIIITRHHPERDEGIVYTISNNRLFDVTSTEEFGTSTYRGEIAEMLFKVSAYNGETLTNTDEGNTVGSLTKTQCSIVIGSLLGDGAMRCKVNALLEVNHCLEQKFYVDWKYQHLANLVLTPPKSRKGNGKRIAYRFTTRSLPELTDFYCWFYPNKIKVIPSNLVLDPLSLAVWFMDDGSKSYKALYLNTQQFDNESQLRLVRILSEQWDMKVTLNKDKHCQRLRIAVSSVPKFKEITKNHILLPFEYKFS